MTDNYLTPGQAAQRLQLNVETIHRWLRSGKLPGTPISRKVWRIEEQDLHRFMKEQNAADRPFGEYVAEHCLGELDLESGVPGKRWRTDCRLRFKGQALWFAVKELAEGSESPVLNGGAFDLHFRMRRIIDEAAEELSEHAGEPCSLVLYSRSLNLADICTPSVVLDAMVGNVSWRLPIGAERGNGGGMARRVSAEGGGLVISPIRKPVNTSISAVIAIERFAVGQRKFHISLAKKERKVDRRLPWEEILEVLQANGESYGSTVLRALVVESPFTNKRLPANIFTGPYDVRWGREAGAECISRVYAGPELRKLEAEEDELG